MRFLFSRKTRAVFLISVILLLGSLASVGFINAQGRVETLRRESNEILEDLAALRADPANTPTIESLGADLLKLKAEVLKTKRDFSIPLFLTGYLSWLPLIGNDLRAIGPLLEASLEAAEAGVTLISTAKEAVIAVPDILPTKTEPGRPLDILLVLLEEGISNAYEHLLKAQNSLNEIKPESLRPDLRALAVKLSRAVSEGTRLAEEGSEAIDLVYLLVGSKGEKNYLLVAQNADELRATGGFIPGAWLIRFQDGQMQPLVFYDSPTVDDLSKQYPAPPEWLGKTLWGGIWAFRDALWYPHFPDSAQAAESLFLLGKGIDVDGVIAFDQWLLPSLLKAVGPININGLREPLNEANVVNILRRETDQEGRAYVNVIMTELLEHIGKETDSRKLISLLLAAKDMLEEKHLLIYLDSPNIQAKVFSKGWAGALQQEGGDYLMVVDSNVGYNKVNANMRQSFDYSVFILGDGQVLGQLQIDYNNLSTGFSPVCVQGLPIGNPPYEEAAQGCYWDYLRVYIPQKAVPLAWPSFPLPPGSLYAQNDPFHVRDTFNIYSDSAKTVLSGFFVIPQRESKTFVFAYRLPDNVLEIEEDKVKYTLIVQKQPGTLGHPIQIAINYPPSWEIESSSLAPSGAQPGRAEFESRLTKDLVISLVFRSQ